MAEWNWDAQCTDCPDGKTRAERTEWTGQVSRLLDLSLMRRGGYPLGKNDLTPDEWRMLGVIEEEHERSKIIPLLAALGARFVG